MQRLYMAIGDNDNTAAFRKMDLKILFPWIRLYSVLCHCATVTMSKSKRRNNTAKKCHVTVENLTETMKGVS